MAQSATYSLSSSSSVSLLPPAAHKYRKMAGNPTPSGHPFEGFNYNKVHDTLYVGACLTAPADLDHLKEKGIEVVLSLQSETDKEQYGVDIPGVRARAGEAGVTHIFNPTPEITPTSLKKAIHLLAVQAAPVGLPEKTVYVHCTAGLARGPTVAIAYATWIEGLPLSKAWEVVTAVRKCYGKREAIAQATAELLEVPIESIDFDAELSEEQKAKIRSKILAGGF